MTRALKPYPAYRDSGLPWLGEVPAHWEILPNRAVFTEVSEENHPDEQMLSVTIANGVIRQHELLENTTKKDGSRTDRTAYKLVRPGDIAYNKMRAWQGAVGASKYRGIISPAYIVQRPSDSIDSRYMHYLLRTSTFSKEAERYSYGIAPDMWSLRSEDFKIIHVCIPPLPEQAAIARYLDRACERVDRHIGAKERLIALLKERKQAIIDRTVTRGLDPNAPMKPTGIAWMPEVPAHWEVRRLRNVADMRVSNVDKHAREGEEPVRLCNYVDVYKNDHIDARMKFMKATATVDELERFRLEEGDILITKDSEAWNDIGVPALVTKSASDLVSGYHLALLKPRTDTIQGSYLHRALQSASVSYQFHVAATGVTRYGLSHADIRSTFLPLPPLSEQAAIVERLRRSTAAIDAAIGRARRQIDLLREYRERLIDDVVTGKLDVRGAGVDGRDPYDETTAGRRRGFPTRAFAGSDAPGA